MSGTVIAGYPHETDVLKDLDRPRNAVDAEGYAEMSVEYLKRSGSFDASLRASHAIADM